MRHALGVLAGIAMATMFACIINQFSVTRESNHYGYWSHKIDPTIRRLNEAIAKRKENRDIADEYRKVVCEEGSEIAELDQKWRHFDQQSRYWLEVENSERESLREILMQVIRSR